MNRFQRFMSREDHGGIPGEILKEEFRKAAEALKRRNSRLIIAHRGLIDGPNSQQENNPLYIEKALKMGYNCEIDVFYDNLTGIFRLGHDYPQYEVPESYLEDERLWCHAKSHESFFKMFNNNKINCFWHQTDDFVITSRGYIWTYPGKSLSLYSICVLPEKVGINLENLPPCLGVCTDYPKWFK